MYPGDKVKRLARANIKNFMSHFKHPKSRKFSAMANLDQALDIKTAFDESSIINNIPLYLKLEVYYKSYRDTVLKLDFIR
jgi:hypothetical protein